MCFSQLAAYSATSFQQVPELKCQTVFLFPRPSFVKIPLSKRVNLISLLCVYLAQILVLFPFSIGFLANESRGIAREGGGGGGEMEASPSQWSFGKTLVIRAIDIVDSRSTK